MFNQPSKLLYEIVGDYWFSNLYAESSYREGDEQLLTIVSSNISLPLRNKSLLSINKYWCVCN